MIVADPRRHTSAVRTGAPRALRRLASSPTALLFLTLVVLLGALGYMKPTFRTVPNLLSTAALSSTTFIAAAGFTIAAAAGVFDLSVGATMMMSGVVFGTLYQAGAPLPLAAAGAVLVGAGIGSINAFLVTKLRINSIIATLGVLFILRGIGLEVGGVRSTQVVSDAFRFARGDFLGLPVPVWCSIVVVVTTHFFLAFTPTGQRLRAVGENPEGASEVALNVNRYRTIALVVSAVLAGLGGVVLASLIGAIDPQAAIGREILIATAAFLGGASLAGGRGSVVGTLMAVFLLASLFNAFIQFALRPEWIDIFSGAILVVAVAINQRPSGGFR